MEDSVKKVIDSLIEQAKTEAETLAEQMELRQIPSECTLSVLGVVFEGIHGTAGSCKGKLPPGQ